VRRFVAFLLRVVIVLLLALPLLILVYRFVPVPLTPLMVLRQIEGDGLQKQWVDYEQLSPNLRRAVIASEDAHFCTHHGFDWSSIDQAWEDYQSGDRLRGASTITQQTAKNLVLWPGGWVRKIIEVYPTVLLELLWPKRRILQTYLNVIEWGPGIYGGEAASRAYFGHSARALTASEAALMAAVLPDPRRWSPAKPTDYIRSRAATIQARMGAAPADCR
jgi:monofunctional biosynthetic peptidoglycan transglycosylase